MFAMPATSSLSPGFAMASIAASSFRTAEIFHTPSVCAVNRFILVDYFYFRWKYIVGSTAGPLNTDETTTQIVDVMLNSSFGRYPYHAPMASYGFGGATLCPC